MSVVIYCKCRIRFQSDDRSRPERNYSERTLIEFRQHEFPDHAIRAIDVEAGKQVDRPPPNHRQSQLIASS